MLSFKESLITEKSVLLNQHADSWEEAVRIAARPLVESEAVKQNMLMPLLKVRTIMGHITC